MLELPIFRFMKLTRKLHGREGFTRVSVLLGVVLASVFVLMLRFALQGLRSSAKNPGLELPLQEALDDALSNFIRTKIVQTKAPCADPVGYFQSHDYLRTYTGSVSQARSAPPSGISATAWNELFDGSMAASSFAGAALSRCSLSVLGTGGRFHFCLQVQRDMKAPKDSFQRAPLIFAEVSMQLLDLQTGRGLSCGQYLEASRTHAGAKVEYLLFAINDKAEELEVTRHKQKFSLRR